MTCSDPRSGLRANDTRLNEFERKNMKMKVGCSLLSLSLLSEMVTIVSSLITAEEAQRASEQVQAAIADRHGELDCLMSFVADNSDLTKLVRQLLDEISHDIMALVASASLIAHNAGVEGEVVIEKVKESEWKVGYNTMNDKYVNLIEAGAIDPAKMMRCALQNAASVAGMVLMTQAIVMEKPKLKAPVSAPAPGQLAI